MKTAPTVLGKEVTDSDGNGGGTVDESLQFVKTTSLSVHLDAVTDTSRPIHGVRRLPKMIPRETSAFLEPLLGQVVVIDLKSTYVCLGTLVAYDAAYLELLDADLHDFRDSTATREVYVYDSVRLGIRRNRERVLVRIDDVVAITRFSDIAET